MACPVFLLCRPAIDMTGVSLFHTKYLHREWWVKMRATWYLTEGPFLHCCSFSWCLITGFRQGVRPPWRPESPTLEAGRLALSGRSYHDFLVTSFVLIFTCLYQLSYSLFWVSWDADSSPLLAFSINTGSLQTCVVENFPVGPRSHWGWSHEGLRGFSLPLALWPYTGLPLWWFLLDMGDIPASGRMLENAVHHPTCLEVEDKVMAPKLSSGSRRFGFKPRLCSSQAISMNLFFYLKNGDKNGRKPTGQRYNSAVLMLTLCFRLATAWHPSHNLLLLYKQNSFTVWYAMKANSIPVLQVSLIKFRELVAHSQCHKCYMVQLQPEIQTANSQLQV